MYQRAVNIYQSVLKHKQSVIMGASSAPAPVSDPSTDGGGVAFSNGLNTPRYKVLKSFPTFEIRQYPAQMWTSVKIESAELPYEKVVSQAFRMLFKYISGANVNKQKVDMTAPVATDIYPAAGPACDTTFIVSFFVPFALQSNPVAPTDPSVFTRQSAERIVAVRSFGGFIDTYASTVQPHAVQLGADLLAQGIKINNTMHTVSVYDSPFKRMRSCSNCCLMYCHGL